MRDIIETKRLVLRPFVETDWKSLVSYAGDIDVARATGRIPHPYTFADAENWIAITKTKTDDHIYGIANKNNDLIGCISLTAISGEWVLGYWLGRDHWHKGLMREASTALLAEAQRSLAPAQLTATVFKDNSRSLALLRFLGFKMSSESVQFCVARGHEVDVHELSLSLEASS